MKYRLQDLFWDVIDTAKESGIWQTLSPDEKRTLLEYFLGHFDSFVKELQWHQLAGATTYYVTAAGTSSGPGRGERR